MSRPTLRWLERWRPVRALIDFHSIVAAHVYLGKATFLLAWVSSILCAAAVQLAPCAARSLLQVLTVPAGAHHRAPRDV